MIDEATQDRATSYVLGQLDEAQAARFREEMAGDAELSHLVLELHESAAELALAVPPEAPPPALLERILGGIREDSAPAKIIHWNWVPWALAAGFAVACAWFALDRGRLRDELVALRQQDALAQVRIATLTAQAEAYRQVLAVVVWDEGQQRGVVKLDRLARPAPGKDYQLWALDPAYPQPVSAGVVTVSEGTTRATFRPTQRIHGASKFALSIERQGGAPQPEGEIIMVSN